MRAVVSLFSFVLFFTSISAQAETWQTTLDSIEAKYEEIYCFKDLKREFFRWNSHREMEIVRAKVARLGEPLSAQAARDELLRYYDATRDIHVGGRFKTSSPYSVSRLPIIVRSHDAKNYTIVSIDRVALPIENYPFQIGDRVVSVGGKPVQKMIDEFLPLFYAQKKTQQALAERYAFSHYDVLGKSMPSGETTVVIERASSRKAESYPMTWITTDKAAEDSKAFEREEKRASGKGTSVLFDERVDGVFEVGAKATKDAAADVLAEAANPVRNYGVVGAKKPFFSPLGEVLWEAPADAPYYAYISKLPNGKKAGYVRVPGYYPRDMTTVMVPGFYALVDRFVDEGISVLVYDQTNNGGGSLLYTYDLLGGLIDRPVRSPMKTEWIVHETHHEVSVKWTELKVLAEKALTDPEARNTFQNDYFNDKIVDDDFIRGFLSLADLMLKTLADPNHARLSAPFPFEGQEFIKPRDGKRYTGPIVMLTNELSISTADLSPALFQDLNRAVLFGSRTAGAGAYQNGFVAPENNPFELWYSTISFGKFTRKGGLPVENLAVTPEIRYDVTLRDLRDGMKGYSSALLRVLERF